MKIRPSAVIVNQYNQILLLKYNYSGQVVYNLPGGNLEFGETLKDTLKRELSEELDINCEIGHLLLIAEICDCEKPGIHFIFKTEILENAPALQAEHTTALTCSWIDINQLNEIKLYPHVGRQLMEKLRENNPQETQFLAAIPQPWY
jgi:8-oxo-dGTP diphosphatase